MATSIAYQRSKMKQTAVMGTRTLWAFLALTFGLSWVPMSLFLMFADQLTPVFGEMSSTHPFFLLAVPGVFMGMAFPLGLSLAGNRPALTPWLWGVNGATSVCASVLAVAISLSTTISTAFWVGSFCYLVALGAFALEVKRVQARAEDPATTGGAVVEA